MNVNVINRITFDRSVPSRVSGTNGLLGVALFLILLLGPVATLSGQPEAQISMVDETIVSEGALRATIQITNTSEGKITMDRPESFAGAFRVSTDGEEVPIAATSSDAAAEITLFPGESIRRTVDVQPDQSWDRARKLQVSWSFGDLSAEAVPAYYFPERHARVNIDGYGSVYVQFHFDDAPRTLYHVTRLIRNGVYDGLKFHRLIKDYLLQGGKQSSDSDVNVPDIPPEFNDHAHEFGTVSMANGHRTKSAGTQFFITLGRQPFLDGRYTVIGKVTDASSRERLRRIQNEVKTDHHKLGGQCGVDHLDRPQEPLVMSDVSLITPETYKNEKSEDGSGGDSGEQETSTGSGTNGSSSSGSDDANR